MKKRLLAITLALTLCLGLAVPAFAADKTTYYLNFNQVTTAEESEISISGEDVKLTGRIHCEDGLGAGQIRAAEDYDSYPVFTASKPVTVTITADYTDWGDPADYTWDEELYVYSARILDVSGTSETGYPNTAWTDLEYFDGSYAVRLENGGVKEHAGSLKDYYKSSEDGRIYIHPGAAVTLSKPGDYLLYVSIGSRWSSLFNFAIIHILPDSGQPTAFTDVPAGAFYADAVSWAVGKDITNGTGDGTTFSPGKTCTHAQILTFLYRAARGEGAASAGDMDKAIAWAREKGMIGADFNPSAPCNRAYAVLYIWQAFDRLPSTGTASFTDVPAGWASAPAVSWAVASGITNGTGAATFSPGKVCTRGEIVTFLHRAYVPEARLK